MAASSPFPSTGCGCLYVPRAIFKSYHARQQRWAVIVAHRRAGKTVELNRLPCGDQAGISLDIRTTDKAGVS